MSRQRDRIDPESREPLEQLLKAVPGGFNAIPDIVARRAAAVAVLAEMTAGLPPNDRVVAEDHVIAGTPGSPDGRARVYRPAAASGVLPGILLIHGGGMIMGSIEAEDAVAAMVCDAVGAVVVSADYRKAPEHPYPAAVEDCYACLEWMADHCEGLGYDSRRLAVFGRSAGGGLALAVALMARDRGGPRIRFVMPIYPMLDDRNDTSSSHEITDVGVWDRAGNIEAWAWYLGGKPADAYAAPARAADLSGLPPAFIDVGEVDLFRDEDISFAARLLRAGVPTEFHVYPGAYHASEAVAPRAALSERIWEARFAALRRALDV